MLKLKISSELTVLIYILNISSVPKPRAWCGLKLKIKYPLWLVQSQKTLCSLWNDLQVFVLLALTLRKSYIWSNVSFLDSALRVETSFSSKVETLKLKVFLLSSSSSSPRLACVFHAQWISSFDFCLIHTFYFTIW